MGPTMPDWPAGLSFGFYVCAELSGHWQLLKNRERWRTRISFRVSVQRTTPGSTLTLMWPTRPGQKLLRADAEQQQCLVVLLHSVPFDFAHDRLP